VEKPYHIIGKEESQELAKFLVKNGQALLPMVELIEQSKLAVDELIDDWGGRRSRPCYGCPRKESPGHRMRGRKVGRSAGMEERKAGSV